jgi:pimeloyl-ACP methyl ester carboxylesterase
VIEGGPHGLNATHPEAFNQALIRFLDQYVAFTFK